MAKKKSKTSKKNNKNRNIKKNEIVKKSNVKKKISNSEMYDILEEDRKNKNKNGFIITAMIIIIVLFAASNAYLLYANKHNKKTKLLVKYKVPENIVFLGDSITDYYDTKKYFSHNNVVNSGISGNKTTDILDNMEERVYRYNPSKVFLLIGINDLAHLTDKKEIISNIEEIIEKIKENRPETKIYLESVYPVNNSDDEKIEHDKLVNRNNEDVIEINKVLEEYCKENKIKYIDLYSKLIDEDGNLKLEYTREGLHISDEGYKFITKELEKYIK